MNKLLIILLLIYIILDIYNSNKKPKENQSNDIDNVIKLDLMGVTNTTGINGDNRE